MNMKENIIFLSNGWTTTGEVDKIDRTDLEKCPHLYDETSAFDRKLSSSGAKKIDNSKRKKQAKKKTDNKNLM